MRRWLLTACLWLLPAAVVGQGIADSVVEQLQAQGYSRFTVETTFLGRLRIVATGGRRWREIVVNPQTGEIVRDYSRPLGDRDVGAPRILWDDADDDDRSGRRDGDDDDDRSGGDDDDDDDDDDEDRSGRGGGDDDGGGGGDDDDDRGDD